MTYSLFPSPGITRKSWWFLACVAAAVVSSFAEGARTYMQQSYAITIPPTLIPDLEQYVRNQLRLVVEKGRDAFLTSAGTLSPVYSLSQLRLDVALFGARRALTAGQASARLSSPPTWLATAYEIFTSFLSRLGPAEAHAGTCAGGVMSEGGSCDTKNDVHMPSTPPAPSGCDPAEVMKKLSTASGTFDLFLNRPDCRITKEQCQNLSPLYVLVERSDGSASCVEKKCGKTFTRSNGETATDKCKSLPIQPKKVRTRTIKPVPRVRRRTLSWTETH